MYSIIPCAEKHNTIKEDFSVLDSPEASVTLQCAYNDRYALVSDLLMNRRPWPYYNAAFTPLATTCSIVNIPGNYLTDASTQLIYYVKSEVTVTYTSKFPNLYSEEIEPYSEFEKLDNTLFRWESGAPLSQNQEVGFLRRGLMLSKTFFDVLDPIPNAIINYVGFVNSDIIINSMGLVFTPETLLFTPPQLSRTVRFDSTNAWQMTCKFVYRKPFPSNDPFPGWNTFWNASQQNHERMVVKPNAFGAGSLGGLYTQYPSVPFTGIFF